MSSKPSDAPATVTQTTCGWCSVRDCDSCRPAGTGWVCTCTHARRIPRITFEAVLAGALPADATPTPETS